MSERILRVIEIDGLTDYVRALEWQRELARLRATGHLEDDLLLLLEHPHVITLGRGARESNVLTPGPRLAELGVEVHEVERGGDVTYHGPGQLVGYPILDLRQHRQDLHWYLRQVEAALVGGLSELGIEAGRVPGYTGVWVGDRKIASIGVHVGRWVTWHGFALNVTTDLSYFDLIVPCGIQAVRMTSVALETGRVPDDQEVRATVARAFASTFDLQALAVRVQSLDRATDVSDLPEPSGRRRSSPAAPPSAS